MLVRFVQIKNDWEGKKKQKRITTYTLFPLETKLKALNIGLENSYTH